jgi:hypothetical protein
LELENRENIDFLFTFAPEKNNASIAATAHNYLANAA